MGKLTKHRRIMQCVDCGVLKRADNKPCQCGGQAFSQPTARAKYEFGQEEKKERERHAQKLEKVKRRYAKDAEVHAQRLEAVKRQYIEEAEREERKRLSLIRVEARSKLCEAKHLPETEHSALQRRRFDRAWCWIFVHSSEPETAKITQVGDKGFHWKRLGQVVPQFVAWGDVEGGDAEPCLNK